MAQPVDQDGVSLARAYWLAVVKPMLDDFDPTMPRAAARIGTGSDVLKLDDEMSRDHDWGLRMQLVVPAARQAEVKRGLNARLPDEFAGHPVRFAYTGRSDPALGIDVLTIDEIISARLGFDPRGGGTALDWLSLTGQAALEVTAGEVFEDTDGQLTDLRAALAWYPDEVWRCVIATDWQRIDQELPLLGRAGDRGDELGSRVIAARLVDITIHLSFLLCRQWAPYSKWHGTMFARLPLPDDLHSHLLSAMAAADWRDRGAALSAALDVLAEVQRAAGLPANTPVCVPFWDRPYLHIDPALVPSLLDGIRDPHLRALPIGLGSIEQRSDNVDLLMHPHRRRQAIGLG